MIKIGNITKSKSGDSAELRCPVTIDGNTQEIWFKVKSKYYDYLCDERSDAYLIASLNYAMRIGHDIECEVPVSETLLYNIETELIPALIEANPNFHKVNIKADIANEPLPNAGAVATGISCGVDSLHAVAEHTASKFSAHNITHLTFNNVGSHGEGERARELYRKRIERPRAFAKEYGFEFVESDSNLMDVINQNHYKSHTYSSMFPILCLQKLYSVYYYASAGFKFQEFELKDIPELCCGSYEMLSLNVFSSPQIKIYSEGNGLSRLGKLKSIVSYPPARKYLNVCLDDGDNCGRCEKCIRTLLGIDILGAIDDFKDVFDIEYYKANKKWYLQQMLYRIDEHKHDYIEMYPHFKDQISLGMRVNVIKRRLQRPYSLFIAKHPAAHKVIRKILGKK